MTWIKHPKLPGQLVQVADGAVPHYRAAGWEVTEAPPKPVKLPLADEKPAPAKTTASSPEVPAETENETEPPKSRRRTTTKED